VAAINGPYLSKTAAWSLQRLEHDPGASSSAGAGAVGARISRHDVNTWWDRARSMGADALLVDLAKAVCNATVASAEVERVFSVMGVLRGKNRCSLNAKTLGNLARIRAHWAGKQRVADGASTDMPRHGPVMQSALYLADVANSADLSAGAGTSAEAGSFVQRDGQDDADEVEELRRELADVAIDDALAREMGADEEAEIDVESQRADQIIVPGYDVSHMRADMNMS
jgi:hypothetical protein